VAYSAIDVRPIAGSLGAEIIGVDLTQGLDNQAASEIHEAFLAHLVIVFRDQPLEPEGLKSFARRVGPRDTTPFVKPLDGHPEILEIVRPAQPPSRSWNFGAIWHSDQSFQAAPAKATLLLAKETPAHGGDTMFANMYDAYQALSSGMKRLLDGLEAVHSAYRAFGPNGVAVVNSRYADEASKGVVIESGPAAAEERAHPVVRRHPETGRKALFVNGAYTTRFVGMTAEESAPLLKFLYEHCTRPEFTCRLSWRRGSMALWDNRCAQHFAINDYFGHRRVMHRVTIAGDRPV